MTDDDTYIHPPSLLSVLSHLSPTKPHYIGNPISTADSPIRFAHGGSGIIFSHSALSQIFSRSDLVQEVKRTSLDALYGDKVLAQLSMKAGIHVNEYLGVHFNYEPPTQSMLTVDNGCEVVVNFHRVATPAAQLAIHKLLNLINTPITWWDIWNLFGRGVGDEKMRLREGWNYVGHIELPIPRFTVESFAECKALCVGSKSRCLAWEWDSVDRECRISPWVIVGFEAKGKFSGVNFEEVTKLVDDCSDRRKMNAGRTVI